MKLNNETKIGILIVIVLLALGVLTYQVGDFNFANKGYHIKVYFKQIDGVDKNAPVRLNGMEVGRVDDVKIIYEPETKMELTLWINEGVKIREGSEVYVRTMGMFGEKYIGLTLGKAGRPYLKPGAKLIGEEPVDFEKLLARGDKIAKNIEEITSNLNERLRVNSESIDTIVLNIKKATNDIAAISENVNERLTKNQAHIDSIVANLDQTSQNLEEMSADIKENPWKLLYKPPKRRKK